MRNNIECRNKRWNRKKKKNQRRKIWPSIENTKSQIRENQFSQASHKKNPRE